MPKSKLKRRTLRLLLTATILLGLSAYFELAIGEAVGREPAEEGSMSTTLPRPGEIEKRIEAQQSWWHRRVTLNGDVRAALALNLKGRQDRTDRTDLLPLARLRGGVTLAATPWVNVTARLATFLNKETDRVGFRLRHRRDIQPGDLTFDSLFLTIRPYQFMTIKVGRLQTEFELDSVVKDSLSRHDSSGLDVSWTDGIHVIVGKASSMKLHLIGQVNPEEGPTNGVGTRGPLEFRNGGTRVTYYAALEAPPLKPFTQLVADLTIIPQALRPQGVDSPVQEDVVALTMRGAADLHFGNEASSFILHPFFELGVMIWTPQEKVLKVSGSGKRADHFAIVTGCDLKQLGPGALGFQFGWAQAGYLISPDYPNNAWSSEVRYKLDIATNAIFEIRYRHRQEIDRPNGVLERQTDDNMLARVTIKF